MQGSGRLSSRKSEIHYFHLHLSTIWISSESDYSFKQSHLICLQWFRDHTTKPNIQFTNCKCNYFESLKILGFLGCFYAYYCTYAVVCRKNNWFLIRSLITAIALKIFYFLASTLNYLFGLTAEGMHVRCLPGAQEFTWRQAGGRAAPPRMSSKTLGSHGLGSQFFSTTQQFSDLKHFVYVLLSSLVNLSIQIYLPELLRNVSDVKYWGKYFVIITVNRFYI